MIRRLVISILTLLPIMTAKADDATELCINEIMQSNVNVLFVEHDFPDSWVELYNPTDADVDLFQYYIGLEKDINNAYRFKVHEKVTAHGYKVIYCDKVGTGLHTDFRLESGKGEIYLFDKNGVIVDKLSHKKMLAPNIAYGRVSDGADEWGQELIPTPGAGNEGGVSAFLLPNPVFSAKGHVMAGSETITVSMPKGGFPADTKVYITTDGSEPTFASACFEKDSVFNVDTTMVIRAKLMSLQAHSPMSVTQSYIFHPRQTNLPIISIATDDDYLYSNGEGIMSEDSTEGQPNWKYEWRRPVNTEYLGCVGDEPMFNQIGETALQGNISRRYPQKSLKLYANKRFGEKRFSGTLWDEKPNVNKVKSFALRNGGTNCLTHRYADGLVQRIFAWHISNLDYQAYQPAIVYINGKYKGEYAIRERSNEDFVEANYNGLEDIELAEATQYSYCTQEKNPLFYQFKALYSNDSITYHELEDVMDVDNFMKTLMTQTFVTNYDWPYTNVSMWRPTQDSGKWRWILKDLDLFYARNASFNMFDYVFNLALPGTTEYDYNHLYTSTQKSLKLYEKMYSLPEFRQKFVDMYVVALGDFLRSQITIPIATSMYEEIYDEMEPTYAEHNNMSDLNTFDKRFRTMKTFLTSRPDSLYSHLAKSFNLGSVIPIKIQRNGCDIKINDVKMYTEKDFDGKYFLSRNLNLKSDNDSIGWKMILAQGDSVCAEYEFVEPEIDIVLADFEECDNVLFIAQYVEYNYSITDVVDLNQHIIDGTTDDLDKNKYDVNKDGVINVSDIVEMIERMLK